MSLLIEAVEKIAPVLGAAMGGPIGGILASLLEKTFGLTGDALTAAVSTDPDAAVKLKEIETQHADLLAQYSNSDYLANVEDRKSARERDEDIIKSGKKDWVLSLIAIIVVVSFFILCVINYFLPIKDDHVLIMLLGQISSGFVMVLSFYFGSSNK